MSLIYLALHATHYSHGPYGWVGWIANPHLSAGLGWVHGHGVQWLETR